MPWGGPVHQNPPHRVRRNREEVHTILPGNSDRLHQPQKSFAHQGCGLQSADDLLIAHVLGGHPEILSPH
jgi:hypothetical protein